jgi:hypothetical protein
MREIRKIDISLPPLHALSLPSQNKQRKIFHSLLCRSQANESLSTSKQAPASGSERESERNRFRSMRCGGGKRRNKRRLIIILLLRLYHLIAEWSGRGRAAYVWTASNDDECRKIKIKASRAGFICAAFGCGGGVRRVSRLS